MRVIRIKNRVYSQLDADDHIHARRRVKSHAEYAVIHGRQIFARIRCVSRNKWVVLERADEQRFGLAVSPLNMISLRDVKQWAIAKYAKGKGERAEG